MKPIPTVNVNLKHCDTPHLCEANGGAHVSACAAGMVPIPCPIPPSVTFTVRIGECTRGCSTNGPTNPTGMHDQRCPARPIRVSCSISGKTWEESEVSDAWPDARPAPVDGNDYPRLIEACRDRWALVKALVTGKSPLHDVLAHKAHKLFPSLFQQRDAVFAALADMARAEEATCTARDAVRKARNLQQSGRLAPELRESAIELADYVGNLVEQVSILEGGQ